LRRDRRSRSFLVERLPEPVLVVLDRQPRHDDRVTAQPFAQF
jgi:hypothetical protein